MIIFLKRKFLVVFILICVCLFFIGCSLKKNKKPNIIFIMADDLGYGDLSCYGQKEFATPNIDNLAKNGILFTNHYSGSTVSAPSRAVLLTGLHSGHSPVRDNKEYKPEGQFPMKAEAITIAEVLKDAGYVTAAFGKWGLGFVGTEGDPNNQGFDEFFGYNCQRYAHRYYPEYIWNNSEKYFLPGNDWTNTQSFAPDIIHEKALDYIEKNKANTFFMYYPSNIPHAELLVPDDEIFEQFNGQFEEKPYKAGNRAAASYGPDVSISEYCPQDYPKATFAAMISRLDKQVGEIVAKTKELGIYKNTIFFFTSDNGPHGEGGIHPDDFNSNGILRGMKRDLYEGGIRVPMIVSWPDKINKEEVSDHISAFWDILPTLAEIAKTDVPVDIDGLSFLPTLFNKGKQKIHDNLYWEFHSYGGRQAVRKGKWKAVKYNCFNPSKTTIELFDLDQDPSEEIDLAVKYPDILAEMEAIMQKEHSFDPEFPFGK